MKLVSGIHLTVWDYAYCLVENVLPARDIGRIRPGCSKSGLYNPQKDIRINGKAIENVT